jgi:WD40 repeat protein
MRNKVRLLILGLAVFMLAAAQEPEAVVAYDFQHAIFHIYISPDGRQILIGTSSNAQLLDVTEKRAETLCFFDGANSSEMPCTPDWAIGARASWAAPSAAGESGTTSVVMVDPRTMKTVQTIAKFKANLHNVRLNLSPNGKYLAYGMVPGGGIMKGTSFDQPGGIKVFDTTNGKELLSLSTNIESAPQVAISADGKYLAGVVKENKVSSLRVWEVATGKLLTTLEGHTNIVSGIQFSPDGQWLASIGDDGAAILWNPAKGFAKVATLKKGPDVLYGKAFSPDGSLLAVAGKQGIVTVWNTKTKKAALTFHHPKPKQQKKGASPIILRLVFDKEGKQLVAGTDEGLVLTWPINAGTATGEGTKTDDK